MCWLPSRFLIVIKNKYKYRSDNFLTILCDVPLSTELLVYIEDLLILYSTRWQVGTSVESS
jgi:hypothetical protein